MRSDNMEMSTKWKNRRRFATYSRRPWRRRGKGRRKDKSSSMTYPLTELRIGSGKVKVSEFEIGNLKDKRLIL